MINICTYCGAGTRDKRKNPVCCVCEKYFIVTLKKDKERREDAITRNNKTHQRGCSERE